MTARLEIPVASSSVRYSASEALDIARSYWPSARVFVAFCTDGKYAVGFQADTGETAAQFYGDTFNEALARAEGSRFPLEDWLR